MKIIPGILLHLIFNCTNSKPKAYKQILDFGSFTIETPNAWTKIMIKGIDSYTGGIAIDKTDTVYFDLGWYSNTLTESEPLIIKPSMLRKMDVLDTSQLMIVASGKSIEPDNYKNNISWDTIYGRKSKIVFPRQSGIGTTGIYIDSLWHSGSGIDRFNLYGNNLKPSNEKIFLRAMKTLKFYKTK